jgi:predicted  nucleic acid-binding Zn-ribbon protein
VIRAWEVTVAAKAAHVTMVCAVEASAQEAVVVWESVVALIRNAEDQAALAEREARERVLRVKAKSAAALASTREEAEGLIQRIALLEGELVESHQSRKTAEGNSQGLSDGVADTERQCEASKRECREHAEELTLL